MVILRIIFFWDWPSYPLWFLRSRRVDRRAQIPLELLSWFGVAINFPFLEWLTVRAISNFHWGLKYPIRAVMAGYFWLTWEFHGGALIAPEGRMGMLSRDWTSADLLFKACQWLTALFPLPIAHGLFSKVVDSDEDLDVGDNSASVENAEDSGLFSTFVAKILAKPPHPVKDGSWLALCVKLMMMVHLSRV